MAVAGQQLGPRAAGRGAGVPRPSWRSGARASYEHQWLLYSRTWRGSIFTSFAQPALFLVAMGMGLGSYVDAGGGAQALGGVSYLEWLAPGLLVSSVMQGSVIAATFPVLAGFHWIRRFHAMHATPLTPSSIAFGLLAWIVTRATLVGAIFMVVIVLFGAAVTPGIILTVPVATLTALAFAAPMAAYMSTQRDTSSFNAIWRFGITPLFLFSGTFFPIEQLPEPLQLAAWLFPLWHGVDLGRALALGTVWENPPLQLAHLVILTVVATAGVVATLVMFRRRLER